MKNISIEDRNIFVNMVGGIINFEYQFSTLLIWQKTYKFQFEILHDAICVFGQQHDGTLQCYYPLGNDDRLSVIVDEIIHIFHKLGLKYNFRPLSEKMRDKLSIYLHSGFTIGTKESYSDYIYDYKRLSMYSGSEYKKKRKEKNEFLARYNYCYEPISQTNSKECLNSLIEIVQADKEYDIAEIEAYKRAFMYFEELHLRGGCIRINGKVEAVAVGEAIGDMVLMHIRRANKKYVGIYPAMLFLLLNSEFSDFEYNIVNTQDDVGNENIRKTKLSYKPILIMKKYFVKEE